jgi:hypothetical protein
VAPEHPNDTCRSDPRPATRETMNLALISVQELQPRRNERREKHGAFGRFFGKNTNTAKP